MIAAAYYDLATPYYAAEYTFNHMNLNPDGKATLCCQSHRPITDEAGRSLNAQTHSMKEISNGTP